ncbi:serine/threonine-protein kinase Nek4 [Aplysia californica]|uniref:non-specific serine/threonine protein kinase n=1 Tax=Aplysia californica TaxID=6500 RepID=A0ABM0JAM9_APLCA|nr:serine/threonine-protein kinase Nek4 [Aplysia californica]
MGNEDFDRLRVIGKGSYGEVWLAKHKKDKKQYVLKKMNLGKASRRERKSAEQEAKLLSKLKHPNIVSYKDSFETDSGFLYIAMQYCEGGDLYAKLKEQRGQALEERQVVEWFVQIAMALQYMHERNILHRDLKTQNIFLTKSKIIKVGDLGIARVLDNASDMATTLIGTPYYMSPELFSNKPYNHKSDVWALGCCVYEMTTLKHAFNAKDMNSLVYKILKGRMPPMPGKYSSELLVLMRSMMHQEPEKRPSVNRILRDPYIKKNIAIFLEDTKKSSRRPSSASQVSIPAPSRPSSAGSSRKNSLPSSGAASGGGDKSSRSSQSESSSRSKAKDEPDSPRDNSAPADLAAKPPPARKSQEAAAPRDLEPIREKGEEPLKSSSSEAGDTQDTVVPQTVKEAKSPKKEGAPRKKNFLRNHMRNKSDEGEKAAEGDKNGGGDNISKPPSGGEKRNSKPVAVVEPQKPRLVKKEDKSRPVPMPRAEESSGLPQRRDDILPADGSRRPVSTDSSKSSSVSSSKEDNGGLDGETPRSLPNLSARQRRRQQKSDTAASYENPNTARIRLRRTPERSGSEKVTRAEKALPPKLMRPQRPRHARQPSLNDSTSSSDESQKVCEVEKDNSQEKELKRENKEMNNFISLLDTTLHMNNVRGNSDDEKEEEEEEEEEEELVPVEEEPVNSRASTPPTPPSQKHPHPDPAQMHKSVSMPSVETLTNTSRLMDRIRLLHKDCIQGVGYASLKKAYEILDKIDEDEVEPKLVELLGMEKFDEYAGKIWQLKFCEEALFMT